MENGMHQAGTKHADDVLLHECTACGSQLVQPVGWGEAGEWHWEVTLRCPECETFSTGVYTQTAVERFDEELDLGTDSVVRTLRRMETARLEEAVAAFSWALEQDLVLPEDF